MEAIFFAIYYKCDTAFYDQIRYIPRTFDAWTLVAECAAANFRVEYLVAIMLRCPDLVCALPPALCSRVEPVLRIAAEIFSAEPPERVQRALGFACQWQYIGLIRDTLAMGATPDRYVARCARDAKFNSLRALAVYGTICMPASQVAVLYELLLREGRFPAARLVARIFCIPEDPIAMEMCSGHGYRISHLMVYLEAQRDPARMRGEWWFPHFLPQIRVMAGLPPYDEAHTRQEAST